MRIPSDGTRRSEPAFRVADAAAVVAAGPADARRPAVTAALVRGPGPARRLVDRAVGNAAPRAKARLGRYDAWRYGGGSAAAFVVPVTDGRLVIVCANRAAGRACRSTAATISLASAQPVSFAALARRKRAIARAVAPVKPAWRAGRATLADAYFAGDQAAAADALATTFREAAARVAADLSREGVPAAPRLAASLTRTADAYSQLADAANAGDQTGFDAARQAIADSEARLAERIRRGLGAES
jgi:hypothetical protein